MYIIKVLIFGSNGLVGKSTKKILSEVESYDVVTSTRNDTNLFSFEETRKKISDEKPAIIELEGHMWKGKADIVNHDEKLIVDLKTTSNLAGFKSSAWKFNYDSQAYIYSKLFGYDFMFIAIDKKTLQIGIFDCSTGFYESGKDKVSKACEAYDLFFKTDDFDPKQYFIQKTL